MLEICKGMATYIPGLRRLTKQATGGTDVAAYCYSVFLRHLVLAGKSRLTVHPRTMAELGPGDSLGISLCGLLTGVERCVALDVVRFANVERNLAIFDELVEMFERRRDIPGADVLPSVRPQLERYEFPGDILDDAVLKAARRPERLERIRRELKDPDRPGDDGKRILRYAVPWNDPRVIEKNSVDMIVSQAVLEHVSDLPQVYRALWDWLRPGGYMSHCIDYRCHGRANVWNGHWAYGDLTWRIIVGRRKFLLNRLPHSAHMRNMKELGFRIVSEVCQKNSTGLQRGELAARFQDVTDEDLLTDVAFVQAEKPAPSP
jgi:SAM-dependent methyltransferase